MRIHAIPGILCLALIATFAPAGDTTKVQPFREVASEDLNVMDGEWIAAINTPDGWKGTMRAKIERKRNHPEVSVFHHFMVASYNLKFTDKKKKLPGAAVAGSERIALVPFQKGKQHYAQFMKDFQMSQKEYLLDLLDYRPSDKKGAAELAALQPTSRDTAPIWFSERSWTLEIAPVFFDYFPRKTPAGQKIDWEPRIEWQKIKSK